VLRAESRSIRYIDPFRQEVDAVTMRNKGAYTDASLPLRGLAAVRYAMPSRRKRFF
jgi:hypothetical protein